MARKILFEDAKELYKITKFWIENKKISQDLKDKELKALSKEFINYDTLRFILNIIIDYFNSDLKKLLTICECYFKLNSKTKSKMFSDVYYYNELLTYIYFKYINQ